MQETVIFITKAPEVEILGAVQISEKGTPVNDEPVLAFDITVYKEGRTDKQIMKELKDFEVLKKLPQVALKINIR